MTGDRTNRTARRSAIAILLAAVAIPVTLGLLAAPTPRMVARVKPQRVVRLAPRPQPEAPPPPNTASPADAGYTIKRVLDIPSPFVAGQYYWDDAGVPDGPVVVTVDVRAQTLSVFRAGYEIGTAVIIYGADHYPTPLGVFPVTQKDADHVSNLYGAPMPYMLRLTNDGVSIHGAEVSFDYATHGCVGVPTRFAKLLFGVVKLGDRVIVTNGETLAVGEQVKAV